MVAVTEKKRTRGPTRTRRRSLAPKRWRNTLCALPGYDPFLTADDCWFDADRADYHVDFIERCCTHIEGALASQAFLLELWQKAIVGNLFGWYRKDFLGRTVRRYRKALIYVPRKNGKTPLVAAIHNDIFFTDDEIGQINNLAAASRDQASKLYRWIVGMINNEPEMQKRCHQYASTRCITKPDNSVTKVIPADENVAHGDNQHFGSIEELHAQPNRKLYDALVTAMASANRIQPLMLFPTTADYDRPSICNEEYKYACSVRDNPGDPNQPGYDPTYLPVIYEARTDDDWTKEDTWRRANPNLGVSVSLDYLRGECRRARENPLFENTFKRLHLNIRTEQAERIIPMEAWDACRTEIDWDEFAGRACWGALDVGATRDFVAFDALFGHDDGEPVTVEFEDLRGEKQQLSFVRQSYSLRSWFWLPERPVTRDPRMEEYIATWTRQGHIIRTPGEVVDYDQVAADISRFMRPYGMVKLAIDQGFQGMAITQTLQKIFGEERIIAVRQGILTMAAPFRELLELIIGGKLYHDGNPVFRWMASNVAAESRGGLIKPSKDKSEEKIDGITAATMALAIAMTEPPPKKSVYETRGIRCL